MIHYFHKRNAMRHAMRDAMYDFFIYDNTNF